MTLLTLGVIPNLKIHQMDVHSAFLNGKFIEDVYMKQLDGYKVVNQGNLVCKLHKVIYGLKQTRRVWNTRINTFLINIGF
jgi:hypothetical protein